MTSHSEDSDLFQRRKIFWLIAAGVFLSTMDSSMINVALPSIMHAFSTTLTKSEWVVLVYLLTITASLVIWGYLADHWGQGKLYLLGMLIFTIGSLLCSIALNLTFLIVFRFAQALGAAMMMATGPAIIRQIYPSDHLGSGFGMLGVATSAGLMSGPAVSGLLLQYFSWRAVFLATVPVGIMAVILGEVLLKNGFDEKKSSEAVSFDHLGAILWIAMISSAVVCAGSFHRSDKLYNSLGLLIVAVFTLLFLRIERKNRQPLFPLPLFRRKYFSIAMVTASLSFVVLFIVLIIMPFYMDFILRMRVDSIGYVMMAVPLTVFIVSPGAGRLYDVIGARALTTVGLAMCGLGVVALGFLKTDSDSFDIAWRLALLGMGQSIFLSPNTASVLSRIEQEYAGITSGMLATFRNIGMLLGTAMAGTAFSFFFSHFTGGLDLRGYTPVHAEMFMLAFRSTLVLAAAVACAGGILSAFREREQE